MEGERRRSLIRRQLLGIDLNEEVLTVSHVLNFERLFVYVHSAGYDRILDD